MSNLLSKSKIKTYYRQAWDGKHSMNAPFLDEFTTFNWRGCNSWKDYGCFIINNKDDLKWLGQSTKSKYSAPLFGSNSQVLESITYDSVKINLKLGLYGITNKDYRNFFNWMNPLIIDKLFFGYDLNYYYIVKVASLSEATKYVIGSQNDEKLYYAEVKVTFEIQGENCGWHKDEVYWHFSPAIQNGVWLRDFSNNLISLDNANWISDLRNGIEINCSLIKNMSSIEVIAEVLNNTLIQNNTEERITLLSLKFNDNIDNGETINFTYNSVDGILYNTENKRMITLLTSEKLTDLTLNKFLLPGKLTDAQFYTKNGLSNESIIRDIQLRVYINGHIFSPEPNDKTIIIRSVLKTPVI